MSKTNKEISGEYDTKSEYKTSIKKNEYLKKEKNITPGFAGLYRINH
jgi:hypothetical protein